ncbi:hypothetical protein GIB67_023389 [Kingdonia uniflora]|uniref:Pentatricopeptide repeat-containing protein n=1 Tax=Kingdonia uniflora TaxID=39325 RepID=A0A7J7LIM1_9MAGN|nr:hypothetical protein GIB67_023389 [Kingdonia uniflora]
MSGGRDEEKGQWIPELQHFALGVPIVLAGTKLGKVQEASLLFIKIQEEGLKPGKVSYNIMLNIYATVGLVDEAEKLFEAIIMTMGACNRKNGRLQYCEWYSKFVSRRLNHCLKMISIVQKGKFGVTPNILVYF